MATASGDDENDNGIGDHGDGDDDVHEPRFFMHTPSLDEQEELGRASLSSSSSPPAVEGASSSSSSSARSGGGLGVGMGMTRGNRTGDNADNDNDNDDDDDDDGVDCLRRPQATSRRSVASPANHNNDGDNVTSHNVINTLPPSSSVCAWSRFSVAELSGACGDFGTLIPLLVAMARERTIYLAPTLFWTGLVHIITGWWWDIPMPLQPMKSIAAVAIAGGLDRLQVTTAGIWMGVVMTTLSVSGGIEFVNKIVPVSVVSGLQMGVGMKLAIRGMLMIQDLPWWGQLDCIFTAVVCTLFSMVLLKEQQQRQAAAQPRTMSLWRRLTQKPPVGLYLFGLGAILSLINSWIQEPKEATDRLEDPASIWFGAPIVVNALKGVTSDDWRKGFLEGAIPQLPLTTLNSVISICLLADTMFAHKRQGEKEVVSRKAACLSVGLLNVVFCPLGCMPNCHGAGGLAGQHRLGAESGTSMIILGLIKMSIAILFGGSLLELLDALPISVLGLMLCIAGHELATTGSTTLVQTYYHQTSNGDNSHNRHQSQQQQQQQQPNQQEQQQPQETTTTTTTTGELTVSLRQATVIAMVTTIVIVGLGKTHYGAFCGWITYMIYGTGTLEFVSWWRWGDDDNNNTNTTHQYEYHTIPFPSSDHHVVQNTATTRRNNHTTTSRDNTI
eukprot:CAMPEP_0119557678 /NCGR_PEP_ID=MMETSP1352-20130426/9269_1 /TAXON_ID=265584 /ORGANISM="Stauroneis constricta, Strain CCMP1120" /LENGTH=669 /DNA_ID=CAMNT_0007604817 /DNA_START=170 /DNA_END=2179 /DNA_ORIENTATION=-